MRDERALLFDMLDSARLAMQYLQHVSFDEFKQAILIRDAVIRRLEVISEAAGKVSIDMRQRLPQLPFAEIVGMRNLITHAYWGIDLEIVWKTATEDLPALIAAIAPLLVSDKPSQS
ncbi:MAG TPA: DUF86 domain-containing protein [Tepidisphaeraceae bacterium]|jgi:uncharacterized protein with HEPN domain